MGYTPTVHAKEARMSTLIVDGDLVMGAHKIHSKRILGIPYDNSAINIPAISSSWIYEGYVGQGTTIFKPASTAVFTLAASDEVRASDLSTPYEGQHLPLTKISELEVPMYYKGGTVRVKVSAAMPVSGNGAVQFYVDGIVAGPVHAFTSPAYVVFSEDVEVTPGTLIEVFGKTSNNKISVKDFQICADDVIHNGIKGALW